MYNIHLPKFCESTGTAFCKAKKKCGGCVCKDISINKYLTKNTYIRNLRQCPFTWRRTKTDRHTNVYTGLNSLKLFHPGIVRIRYCTRLHLKDNPHFCLITLLNNPHPPGFLLKGALPSILTFENDKIIVSKQQVFCYVPHLPILFGNPAELNFFKFFGF